MAERSRFWDGTTTGDATVAPYDASTEFSEVMMSMTDAGNNANRGVVYTGLALSTTGANNIRISAGRAQVYGTWYENDANVDLVVPTPAVSTRYDLIVLRKSWAAQTVRLTRIAGTEGAGVSPAPVQIAGTTWDFPIGFLWIPITTGIVNPSDLRSFGAEQGTPYNLLTNPGFEIWQRGVGPFTATAVYTADRWLTQLVAGGTQTITQESTIKEDGSQFSAKIVAIPGVSGSSYLYQTIEDWKQLRGKTITFSARVRSNVANSIFLHINASTITASGAAHPGDSAFRTLSVTITVPTNATALNIYIINSGNATITSYVDNATLAVSPSAVSYVPLHPTEDMARCQRYYQLIPYYYEKRAASHLAGQAISDHISFKVAIGSTPTVTKVSTWSVNNCVQPTVDIPTAEGCRISTSVVAAGDFYYLTPGITTYISIEWNP